MVWSLFQVWDREYMLGGVTSWRVKNGGQNHMPAVISTTVNNHVNPLCSMTGCFHIQKCVPLLNVYIANVHIQIIYKRICRSERSTETYTQKNTKSSNSLSYIVFISDYHFYSIGESFCIHFYCICHLKVLGPWEGSVSYEGSSWENLLGFD